MSDVPEPRLRARYKKEIMAALMKRFGYKSPMQVPRLERIVVNMGLGAAVGNPKIIDSAVVELSAITGQKPVVTRSKKAIANFNRPPNFSPRHRERCHSCGRPRAVYRDFKLCRLCFRHLALKGELPGFAKAGWRGKMPDPNADMLTRIRTAALARHEFTRVPA